MSEQVQQRHPKAWLTLGLLVAAWTVDYMDRQNINVLFPLIGKSLGISLATLGGVVSAYLYAYTFIAPVAGAASDRWGRRAILIPGLVFYSITTFFSGLAGSAGSLFTARALTGVGAGTHFPVASAYVADLFPESERGRAMGIHQIGFGLGAILGPTLAIAIAIHWGWRISFFLYLIPGIVVAALIWKLAPEVVRMKSAATYWSDVRNVLSWRLVPFMLTQAVALFVLWMYYTWVPSYAIKTLHIGLFHSGLFGTIVPGMAIVSQPLGGWISDKIGRRNALLISFGVSLVMIIALPFAHEAWQLVTVLMCVGMANWFTPVTFSYIGDLYRNARGTACSVVEFAGFFFGGAPAPFIIGAIAQRFGFHTAFTIGTILLVIGFIVTLTLLRRSVVETSPTRLVSATA